jgi:hypothetical protein
MIQTGLFDAIERAQQEQRQREYEEKFGWTKERAKNYEPGHPWCDPEAYPTAEAVLAEPMRAATWSLHNWPTSTTPKASAFRATLYKTVLAQRAEAAVRYEAARLGLAPVSEYDLVHSYRNNLQEARRSEVASFYNHLVYHRNTAAAAVEKWPELAQIIPESGN